MRLLHLGEKRPGMVLSPTAHIDLNQRVEGDLVWLETSKPHGLEEIIRLKEHFINSASFEQRIKSNLVRLHKTLDATVENLFYERDSSFHVASVDTRIDEKIQRNFRLDNRLVGIIIRVFLR